MINWQNLWLLDYFRKNSKINIICKITEKLFPLIEKGEGVNCRVIAANQRSENIGEVVVLSKDLKCKEIIYFAFTTCCCITGEGFPWTCRSCKTRLDLYAMFTTRLMTSFITRLTGPGPIALGSSAKRLLLSKGPVKHRWLK